MHETVVVKMKLLTLKKQDKQLRFHSEMDMHQKPRNKKYLENVALIIKGGKKEKKKKKKGEMLNLVICTPITYFWPFKKSIYRHEAMTES